MTDTAPATTIQDWAIVLQLRLADAVHGGMSRSEAATVYRVTAAEVDAAHALASDGLFDAWLKARGFNSISAAALADHPGDSGVMRKCRGCHRNKPIEWFPQKWHKGEKNGRHTRCTPCRSKASGKAKAKKAKLIGEDVARERMREAKARYRDANPDRQRILTAARRDALALLAKAHPVEFEALLASCRAERGLNPTKHQRVHPRGV